MKVSELIKHLSECDENAEVEVRGTINHEYFTIVGFNSEVDDCDNSVVIEI
ncbi:hypothetical protein QUN99_003422 [Vibrio parahaemolyticus]|nr:hypothetical protein [Vibrio parahaemolyticus]